MPVTELKKGSGQKPLWSQLFEILKERIAENIYEAGSVLPTEAELMKEFTVSRITVRQAMNRLLQEGYISRRRGSGTVVLSAPGTLSTSFHSTFKGEEHNHLQDRRVLSVGYGMVPQEAADFFGTSVNQPLLTLVRESYLNEKPVVRYVTYLSPACMVKDTDDFSGSLYKLLEELGDPIDRVSEVITAFIAGDEEKKIFHLNKETALIRRIRKGYSHENPVEYTDSLYLSDDYQLTIEESFTKPQNGGI